MAASSFFANVTDNGVSVSTEQILKLHHDGGVIQLKFQSTAHMQTVVDTIVAAMAPEAVPTTPVDGALKVDDLTVGVGGLDVGTDDSGSETEYEDCSGSETEHEAPPASEQDPESSFESYSGVGMTQEAFF